MMYIPGIQRHDICHQREPEIKCLDTMGCLEISILVKP